MTTLDGAVVLVTGSNGGLGTEFVRQALNRGAAKVYATARTPKQWNDDRVVPIVLDIRDSNSIAAAAAATKDTTVVVNNAGLYRDGDRLIDSNMQQIRDMFETNFFGAVEVGLSWAPILGSNGGGALVDVHSLLSWVGFAGSYSASKAALWSATNSLRIELAPQGTQVVGVHLGLTDTPMTAEMDGEKGNAVDVVAAAYDGLEAGLHEVVADAPSAAVKAGLSGPIEELYPELKNK